MGKIVLLAVAAAWAAVLIPPLIRSRIENRPNSSVTDFRRQLSTLQRAVPGRGMAPMRSIGRPLTQAPSARTAARQSAPAQRSAGGTSRGHLHVATLDRPAPLRSHATANRRPSPRETRRRRRSNVLFLLVAVFGLTLFLFATTKSDVMMYAFVLSFFSLMGYCYKLVLLRNQDMAPPPVADSRWYHAA